MNFGRLAKISKKSLSNNNSSNNKSSNNTSSFENNFNNNYNSNNNQEYQKIKSNMTINTNTNFEVITNNYKFVVNHKKMKSGNEIFEILNGQNKICVKIVKFIDNNEVIYLQHLNYFESCSKNKSLLRKNGTLEMLNGMLEFVYRLYPNQKYYFEDDSSITIGGHILRLNILYVLIYGKTWYMKNINAIPIDKEFNQKLSTINEYLTSNLDELKAFFIFEEGNEMINEETYNIILSKSSNKNLKKSNIFNSIKKIYNESTSSRDFLQKINSKFGMSIFLSGNYYSYYDYINRKIHSKLNFNTEMEIPEEYMNSLNVINSIDEI